MTANITRCGNIMDINFDGNATGNIGGIVGSATGAVSIEECYHIGDIIVTKSEASVGGISGNTSKTKNCYNVGDIKGSRINGGISGFSGDDCFNCYSVGSVLDNYCCGVINGMNYGKHIVHCFGRRGDFGTLPEGELTESQILNYLSTYNNNNGYGHSEYARMGYKCNVLTDGEMKNQKFVDELNILITADSKGIITETSQSVWKMDTEGINNGYPIFTWQKKIETE